MGTIAPGAVFREGPLVLTGNYRISLSCLHQGTVVWMRQAPTPEDRATAHTALARSFERTRRCDCVLVDVYEPRTG